MNFSIRKDTSIARAASKTQPHLFTWLSIYWVNGAVRYKMEADLSRISF